MSKMLATCTARCANLDCDRNYRLRLNPYNPPGYPYQVNADLSKSCSSYEEPSLAGRLLILQEEAIARAIGKHHGWNDDAFADCAFDGSEVRKIRPTFMQVAEETKVVERVNDNLVRYCREVCDHIAERWV